MKKERLNIRYSESFKLQIVSEIETEGLNINESAHKYGIGYDTVKRWVLKYGTLKRISKLIRVETPNDQSRLRQLEQENLRLKVALADAIMDKDISEIQLEIFCEKMGLDIAEIKKKVEQKRSEERQKRGMR